MTSCKNQPLTLVVYFSYIFTRTLFDPQAKSQILNDKKLRRDAISKLLNEIFSLDREENESMVQKFAKEYDITSL